MGWLPFVLRGKLRGMSGTLSFPQTQWTQLNLLRGGNDSERNDAMSTLYQLYRRPILAFLAGRGFAQERAEDLVQDFFLHAITHQLFEKADALRGKFRSLMLSALQHYAANAHRHEQAQRRRPAGGFVAADELMAEGGNTAMLGIERGTPEQAFIKSWAQTLLKRVVKSLEAECLRTGKQTHFQIFHRSILAPILEGAAAPSQRDMAAELGLTEKEVANRLVTARRAYQRLLRAEVASYASSEEDVDAEIRELFQQLSRP